MKPDKPADEESDEVGNSNVSEEQVATNVSNSEHGKEVTVLGVDVFEVVGNVDRNENATCENGDASEEPPKQAVKA